MSNVCTPTLPWSFPRIGKMRKRGFTLVELMVVCALIGILAFFVIPNFTDMYYQAEATATHSDLNELKKAAIAYRVNSKTGDFPPNLAAAVQGLTATESRNGLKMRFVDKPEWFTGEGSVDLTKVVDSWGNPITYTRSNVQGESSFSSTGNGKSTITVKF